MFDVNVVTELESADQRRRDVRAQTRLLSDQLLQTSDGERVLGTDIHRSYRETRVTGRDPNNTSSQDAFRYTAERRSPERMILLNGDWHSALSVHDQCSD